LGSRARCEDGWLEEGVDGGDLVGLGIGGRGGGPRDQG
jgi:hypothetical protein